MGKGKVSDEARRTTEERGAYAGIMAHMIAGFPDYERSLAVAHGLADGGCLYIELQFPFSEPTADGPFIQQACNHALEQGFSLRRGFALLEEIRRCTDRPIFLMSYANPIFVYGVESFLDAARKAGARGIIAPDLPPDYDEGLYRLGPERGLDVVPVVSVNVSDQRLEFISSRNTRYLYAAMRRGITGQRTEVGEENLRFLDRVRATGLDVMAGFGISERRQIELIAPHVHAAVVGTALVRDVMENPAEPYEPVRRKMAELAGSSQRGPA